MKAVITGENDELVGVNLRDNNGTEHIIEMTQKGEITAHQQDGYSDEAAKRTQDGNVYVEQARRYAKYYVYKERGYDTVEHAENPEYVDAVRQAIADLSPDDFEQYFWALHQQLRSHDDAGRQRVVEIPAGARAEDAVIYELDAYLGVDLQDSDLTDRAKALARARGLDLDAASSPRHGGAVSEKDLEDWTEFGDQLIDSTDPDTLALNISAVSGIHVGYPDVRGEHQVQRAEDPLDREPDATIELMAYAPESLEGFREYLDHHLRCQVRDCVVGMGLVPPEPFRVLGFGKFIYARRYDQYDLYPRFHKRDGGPTGLLG